MHCGRTGQQIDERLGRGRVRAYCCALSGSRRESKCTATRDPNCDSMSRPLTIRVVDVERSCAYVLLVHAREIQQRAADDGCVHECRIVVGGASAVLAHPILCDYTGFGSMARDRGPDAGRCASRERSCKGRARAGRAHAASLSPRQRNTRAVRLSHLLPLRHARPAVILMSTGGCLPSAVFALLAANMALWLVLK